MCNFKVFTVIEIANVPTKKKTYSIRKSLIILFFFRKNNIEVEVSRLQRKYENISLTSKSSICYLIP
ncbi:hypothetical protein EGY07_19240 [Chryseobacterium indologenes]|uniref:Uncharacterized protein n=1 Tax=Chryseobacterium indologenes TaxID=253 RepID=A0AAD0YYM6_CHRID|nr:hypothetical protein CRN76_20215 [Chryseobacterium indologenes]AYY83708.1 hypothetical protein EGX91_03610 [Chryseobacterium indologenes]AYZ37522.1 hypothetical protein EGY07_19240 [Chryseobacterium indologenes]AZB19276.1 hypothetical protein EG352_16580 [Chryseobacterium indologenes]TLX27200.1 hypothetical protein FE904_02095 [Chryseobacterium indologenes]